MHETAFCVPNQLLYLCKENVDEIDEDILVAIVTSIK